MNNKKNYTAQEVAVAILQKAQELYKESSLAKAEGKAKIKAKDGEIPNHEKGMSPIVKEIHDITEPESDKEEVEDDKKIEAYDKEHGVKEKKEEEDKNKKEKLEKSEEVLELKLAEIKKSLFEDYNNTPLKSCDYVQTKSDVANDIKWKTSNLKELKEMRWTVEEEFKDSKNYEKIKDILEKQYKKITKEIEELVVKYGTLKKSEETAGLPEMNKAKAETAPSKKPPKEWWDKHYAEVKAGNPSYSDEQVKETVGSIWYHKMSVPKRKEARKEEGKTYGKAKLKKFMDDKQLRMKDVKWMGTKPKGRPDDILKPADPHKNVNLVDLENAKKLKENK